MTTKPSAALEAAFRDYVARGEMAGAVALVWRPGQAVRGVVIGRRDVDRDLPATRDTIFRIASLTKPITSVAALTLLDEGRFALDEPITRVAPELGNVRVIEEPGGPVDRTVPAERAITFRDLLTHRSGLTYGEFHRGPIGAAYSAALGGQIDNVLSPDEWIARLATLPLIDQPGAAFRYGASTDLLGFLVARLEGAPLSAVLARRVFAPLGMSDTGFTIAPEKRERGAGLCGFDDAGRPTALRVTPNSQALEWRPESMTFEAGGQGLWSTLDDYLAFARMLLGDSPTGAELLRPETRALMSSNQLSPA